MRRGQTSQADRDRVMIPLTAPALVTTRQPTAFSRMRRAATPTVSSGVGLDHVFDHPLLQFHAAISVFCATNTRSKSVTESMPTTRKSATTGNELMR